MKRTIMSLGLELITQEANREKVLDEMTGNLEGSKVVIITPSDEVFINECIGGQATYISKTDGETEEVLYDTESDKLEYQFLRTDDKLFKVGDLIELEYNNRVLQFEVFYIMDHFFLHNRLMNIVIAHDNKYKKLEDLRQYVEENYINYRVFKHI